MSVDKIPNKVLKNKSCVEALHAMYNICLKNAVILDKWRKAIISPIFKGKGKDPKDPLHYYFTEFDLWMICAL